VVNLLLSKMPDSDEKKNDMNKEQEEEATAEEEGGCVLTETEQNTKSAENVEHAVSTTPNAVNTMEGKHVEELSSEDEQTSREENSRSHQREAARRQMALQRMKVAAALKRKIAMQSEDDESESGESGSESYDESSETDSAQNQNAAGRKKDGGNADESSDSDIQCLECKSCKKSTGTLYKCSVPKCSSSVHRQCLVEMRVQFVSDSKKRNLNLLAIDRSKFFCGKRCFLRLFQKTKRKNNPPGPRNKRFWDSSDAMEVLIEWLTTHGNYNKWKGGDRKSGVTKKALASQIAR
jgi:hypothetical protein